MIFKRNRSKRSELKDISLTPLIDVALTLLIIFIVASPMINDSIKLNLPETKNNHSGSPQLTQESLIISVTKDGIYLNNVPLNINKLKSEVADKIKRTSDKVVAVRGDKNVMFEDVTKIVDQIKGIEGIASVALVTKHINKT